MERREHRHYIPNPVRLMRLLAEVALRPVRSVDDALYEFGDYIENRPYNETNYPPITHIDGPYETEEELM